MLSFGQLIEEGNNVETCVLQQPEPQGYGQREEKAKLGQTCTSEL